MKALRRSSRKPDVDQLTNDPRFQQLMELEFGEMIPFVLSNIRKKGPFSFLYFLLNTILLLLIIVMGINGLAISSLSWSSLLLQATAGVVAGSILIIPPHEFLHGVAYWILGARRIRFGADLKQFIFYVTADRYPVSGAELYFLAMTPFVVINAVILSLTLLCLPQWILFSLILLLSHNVMCIGDFAILNFTHHTNGKIYTYDVPELKRSYFFEEVQEAS